MPATRISEEGGEAFRRSMVEDIARRGSQARETKAATVAPAIDLAAAAAASVQADPVDLGPAASATAAAIGGGPAGQAEKFAEAQRIIFERGRGREAAGAEGFADASRLVGESTNAALLRYEQQLAAMEAERAAAAARSRSSGSGSGSGSGTDYGDLFGDQDLGDQQFDIKSLYAENRGPISAEVKALVGANASWEMARQVFTEWFEADGLYPEEINGMLIMIQNEFGDKLPSAFAPPNPDDARQAGRLIGANTRPIEVPEGSSYGTFFETMLERQREQQGLSSSPRTQHDYRRSERYS